MTKTWLSGEKRFTLHTQERIILHLPQITFLKSDVFKENLQSQALFKIAP
jgi:hypothetical protein